MPYVLTVYYWQSDCRLTQFDYLDGIGKTTEPR